MTLCRIIYYGYNYTYFSELKFGELLWILVGGIRFDLAMLAYGLSVYLILSLVGVYLPRRIASQRWYRVLKGIFYLVPMSIYLVLNISDTGYYPYVLRRANSSVFSEFHGKTMVGFYKEFITDYWPLTLIYFALLLLLFIGYFAFYCRESKVQSLRKKALLTFVSLLLCFVCMRGTLNIYERPLNEILVESYTNEPKYYPIVLNTPYTLTIKGKMKYREYDFFGEEELPQLFIPRFQATSLGDNDSLFGAFADRNIMVIVMESMSREFIGALNKDIDNFSSYTPFLDSIMGVSLYAKYGYANGKRSVEAFPAIFSSLPTFGGTFDVNENDWQMYHYQHFNSIATGLPRSLKGRGYDMKFYHGDKPDALGFMRFLRRFGMQQQYTLEEYDNLDDYDGKWAIYDAPFLRAVADDMDGLDEKFLSIFFSATNHSPFNLPEEERARFRGGSLPIHATVQYADDALRRFFEKAKDKSWYNNTLFVFVADHTSLTNHPAYDCIEGHSTIPIIFFDPQGKLQDEVKDYVVQQADIFPTLLYLIGDTTPVLSYGHNILDKESEHYALNFLFDHYILFHKEITVMMDVDGNVRTHKPAPLLQTESENSLDPSDGIRAKYINLLRAIVQDYNNRVLSNSFVLDQSEITRE